MPLKIMHNYTLLYCLLNTITGILQAGEAAFASWEGQRCCQYIPAAFAAAKSGGSAKAIMMIAPGPANLIDKCIPSKLANAP
eukprot:scaffold18006_cov43-Prasinocladus_malaysianus.AAC.1